MFRAFFCLLQFLGYVRREYVCVATSQPPVSLHRYLRTEMRGRRRGASTEKPCERVRVCVCGWVGDTGECVCSREGEGGEVAQFSYGCPSAFAAATLFAYCCSSATKALFGWMRGERSRTNCSACSKDQQYFLMTYEITHDAERDCPLKQCTRHAEPLRMAVSMKACTSSKTELMSVPGRSSTIICICSMPSSSTVFSSLPIVARYRMFSSWYTRTLCALRREPRNRPGRILSGYTLLKLMVMLPTLSPCSFHCDTMLGMLSMDSRHDCSFFSFSTGSATMPGFSIRCSSCSWTISHASTGNASRSFQSSASTRSSAISASDDGSAVSWFCSSSRSDRSGSCEISSGSFASRLLRRHSLSRDCRSAISGGIDVMKLYERSRAVRCVHCTRRGPAISTMSRMPRS
eukprot:Rhum_TRINITY_DN13194_c1_g2::Rhum_TRINITY_DN13194_c1_g2_i1::g.57789::m.57789